MKNEYKKEQEVTFVRGGKEAKGKIIKFLTRNEAKECLMWYIPLVVELIDNTTVEIADYELI